MPLTITLLYTAPIKTRFTMYSKFFMYFFSWHLKGLEMCIILMSSHLSEWNHCDWPRSSALWTTMKILTVCIGKLQKIESWFFRIPTPPSPFSKPLRVTKEHLRLLPSLMYLSHLKAQYWFWVTLIYPQPFARLSPVCRMERARESERGKWRLGGILSQ